LVKVRDWQRGREILSRRIRSQFAQYENNEEEFSFLLIEFGKTREGEDEGFPIHCL
jgi:hypothetical protein